MGCGGNCVCAADKGKKEGEILSAIAPDGTDITSELQGSIDGACKSKDCQKGTCKKGDDCCKV